MIVFEGRNLTYYYPDSNKASLKNLHIVINEGDFILISGPSGSGKSTLGKVLGGVIPELYGGKFSGEICTKPDLVGMVFQNPERQLVMNKVEREVAFGLENLGIKYDVMRDRVPEMMELLDICHLKDKRTYEISGGEKQKVVICSIIAMGHKLLVMDEVTSQLDIGASCKIFNIIKKLNKEFGYTIVLIDHKVDKWLQLADKILFMNEGQIIFNDGPEEFILWSNFNKSTLKCDAQSLKIAEKKFNQKEEVINAWQLHYTYNDKTEALKGVDMSVFNREIIGIMGENGCGKSTLLKVIAKLLKAQKGDISIKGRVGYLSQEPDDYLFNDTVYEELKYTLDNLKAFDYTKIKGMLETLELLECEDKNPRDLSGGEKQRVALASVLVMEPDILVLDEPARGLDKALVNKLCQIIIDIKSMGGTVIIATHDVQLAGSVCDRIFLMEKGSIVKVGKCKEILASYFH